MKKHILYLITIVFCNTVTSQVLYTENFDLLTVGAVSNDATGTTPGQYGWFTQGGAAADYSIAAEPGKGNILRFEPITAINTYREVFRVDLGTYWQQRAASNKVLKFSFDFYTDNYDHLSNPDTHINVLVYGKNDVLLFGFMQQLFFRDLYALIHDPNIVNGRGERLRFSNGQALQVPQNTWLTFEVYLDYGNDKVYYSIPLLNYTIAYDIPPIDPNIGVENSSTPAKLLLRNEKSYHGNYTLKFDNINFSAQSTTPVVTVGVNEVLSNSFNLYPNPATNVVNITNSENMLVQQIAVYDTAGKLIKTENYNNQTEIQLNVENLASGTYMLHIKTNEGTAATKLVKK